MSFGVSSGLVVQTTRPGRNQGMTDVCMRDGWSDSPERFAQIKHGGDVQ